MKISSIILAATVLVVLTMTIIFVSEYDRKYNKTDVKSEFVATPYFDTHLVDLYHNKVLPESKMVFTGIVDLVWKDDEIEADIGFDSIWFDVHKFNKVTREDLVKHAVYRGTVDARFPSGYLTDHPLLNQRLVVVKGQIDIEATHELPAGFPQIVLKNCSLISLLPVDAH